MSSRQLTAWMAYAELEPFGEERADLRMGIQTAELINIQLDKKVKKTTATDFMPYYEPPEDDPDALDLEGQANGVQSADDLYEAMKAFFAQPGDRDTPTTAA